MRPRAAVCLAVLMLVPVAAVAQSEKRPQGAHAEISRLCATDYTALCPNANPDSDELETCVREHSKELSPGCRDAMANEEQAKKAAGGK